MNPTTIRKEICLLPPRGVIERTYAKDQPEYNPLPALITIDGQTLDGDPAGRLVTMWQPTSNELELLKNGAPVTITLHCVNHARPILPMQVEVGGVDLR